MFLTVHLRRFCVHENKIVDTCYVRLFVETVLRIEHNFAGRCAYNICVISKLSFKLFSHFLCRCAPSATYNTPFIST